MKVVLMKLRRTSTSHDLVSGYGWRPNFSRSTTNRNWIRLFVSHLRPMPSRRLGAYSKNWNLS